MNFLSRLTKLNLAKLEDRAAKQEALHRGMVATKPLSAVRLKELCVLGERMMAASRELAAAEDSFFNDFGRRPLDFVIPDC